MTAKWQQLNQFREAVLSEQGPPLPATRYVLLVLASYSGPGCVAFPSIKAIAKRSKLSERTVRDHLERAVSAGWLHRGKRNEPGKRWHHYVYQLITPEQVATIAACSGYDAISSGNHCTNNRQPLPTN